MTCLSQLNYSGEFGIDRLRDIELFKVLQTSVRRYGTSTEKRSERHDLDKCDEVRNLNVSLKRIFNAVCLPAARRVADICSPIVSHMSNPPKL